MFEAIYQIHKKYAPNDELLDLVWSHSRIVANIAKQVMENHPELSIDKKLLLIGCLLHDIGVYFVELGVKLSYIKHGIIGADIARKEGFSESVAKIIERHIGVGISKEEIVKNLTFGQNLSAHLVRSKKNLPLPHKNFIPKTLEEKLVAYADNFHSKNPKFNSYAQVKEKLGEYGKDTIQRLEQWKKLFGVPDLTIIEQSNIESPPSPRLRRV